MRKKYEAAESEKNAAVMKYVKSESDLIRIRKDKDVLTKRLKSIESEREESAKKLKVLASEKASLLQTFDAKVSISYLSKFVHSRWWKTAARRVNTPFVNETFVTRISGKRLNANCINITENRIS